MEKKINKRATGSRYEERAAAFLKENGLVILELNFRTRFGEIDMIAKDESTFVFVEVKYRKNCNSGTPLEAVGIKKQRTICKVCDSYRMMKGIGDFHPIRFDVVGICGEEIEWLKNAFSYVR